MEILPIGVWEYLLSLQQKSIELLKSSRMIKKFTKLDLLNYHNHRHTCHIVAKTNQRTNDGFDDRFEVLKVFSQPSEFIKMRDCLERILKVMESDLDVPKCPKDTLLWIQLANTSYLQPELKQEYIDFVRGNEPARNLSSLILCLVGFGLIKEYQKIHLKRMELFTWYCEQSGIKKRFKERKEYEVISALEKELLLIFNRVYL
jgi:hypothetical protein